MTKQRNEIVSWFSAGVSSAVATKFALEKYPELKIIYIDIEDQHPDSIRFVKDCENWYKHPITILMSPLKSVANACLRFGYINGVAGARCTQVLKKKVRKEWEAANSPTTYIWGMDSSKRERGRALRIDEGMPEYKHEFPLIERNLTKQDAHAILKRAGIKRPMVYDLGYQNNNCIGCVKGSKGYWNKIRKDFPEVFAKRAAMERKIGASCINGCYLDELEPSAGREPNEIMEDCGIMCEINAK